LKKMKVIGLQLDISWENKPANHAKASAMIEAAKPQPGSLVVLPEMFATGFSMNVAAIHDSDDRETQDFLAKTAADYRIYLLGGVVTKDVSGRGRNECVVYSPQGLEVARYCKLQPFTLGGESDNYVAGENTCLFTWADFTVAPFICYDLRFPEIFRAAVRRGANLYTVIASWPIAREEHWITLLKARAIENQAYVVGVNRSGRDPNFVYPGRSIIVHPSGEVLADAGIEESFLSVELNLEDLAEYRRKLPFLNDMRTEARS
jgi:predicted amidohydrolase